MTREKIIEDAIIAIDKCLTFFKDNKLKLEEFYNSNYGTNKNMQYYDRNGNSFFVYQKDFSWFYSENINFLNRQRAFLEEMNELEFITKHVSSLNQYMSRMIEMCVEDIKNYPHYFSEDCSMFFNVLYRIDLSKEYQAIFLLKQFSIIDKDIILVGGNGSGKTSFANALKGNDTSLITVVPAQKNLFYSVSDPYLLTTDKQQVLSILLENNIKKTKSIDDSGTYFNYNNNQFTRLIEGMKTDYLSFLLKKDRGETTEGDENRVIFFKLKTIFGKLFPEIELLITEDNNRSLMCRKNGNIFNVNALSEGEKSIIYYSISVLLAKEASCVIVDEPETYINPSLTNQFWDLLKRIRNDCQFIFITHSVDFVLGRTNAQIAWIKNFNFPTEWNFELLKEGNDLPKPLLTEILGSKKPIIYCEGDKSSLDFHAYNALLGDSFTIIPAGGHHNVVSYCRTSKTMQLGYEVYGIIDGDEITDEQKNHYCEENIFVLPFNEIEMFLLEDDIINTTVSSIYPADYESRIETFKNSFWDKVSEDKERIILNYVRANVNNYIEKHKIKSNKSLEDIKEALATFGDFDISSFYDEKKREIETILENKNYSDLLKVCNLKGEISKGIANRELDKDYEEKALQRLQTDIDLKKSLVEKYFSFFIKD